MKRQKLKLPRRNAILKDKKIDITQTYKQLHRSEYRLGHFEKPQGLWYSCGDDWYNFIIEAEIKSFFKKYIHSIEIKRGILTYIDNGRDPSKILVIKNMSDFEKFEKKYGKEGKDGWVYIEWTKVSKDYSGIEICPYFKSIGGDSNSWYHAWDVASGIIWNLQNVIKSTEVIYVKNENKYEKV